MSVDRWVEVERLFAEALEFPEDRREAFVRATASHPDVAHEVSSLLAAHARPGLFDALTEMAGRDRELETATRLGAWEIVGELGRGGMGRVYRVRRADGQFQQEAALKILPSVAAGPDAESRFLAERQILARLSHRHIATLLDGGVSDDGRPWFVMERVDGVPLDAYCDHRRLGIDARLRIFLLVCGAVQYAHQNLIVHRDLKPSNILVAQDGEPRLLDFGIAKVLQDDAQGGDPAETRVGTRVLTPEYASPEQLRGDPVTTASDVYQLGLLLRRLLLGPGAPNGANSQLGASLPRGDLEAIVSKSLRPEPEERYGTAGQLADDVERHLAGLPVLALPDTWRYVSGKFVRRHALGLSAMAAAFMLVTGLALGMRRQAVETALERDRAERVVELLAGLFRSADPVQALGPETTVRDVMDQGVARVREELGTQPAVQATLLTVIADVYANLGLREQAIEVMGEGLAAGARGLERDDLAMARAERRLASLHAEAGNFAVADSLLPLVEARLDALARASAPAEHARALNEIGYAWQVIGRRDRAQELLETALATWASVPDAGEEPSAAYTNLGWLMLGRAELDSAEVLFRSGLALRREALGSGHPRVATSLEALSGVLTRQGKLEEAGRVVTEALQIRERALPPEHPSVLGLRLRQGEVFRREGRFEEAEAVIRDVLDAQIRTFGEPHFVIANTQNELAIVLRGQGRLAEAEPYLRASLEGYRRAFGDEHVNPAIIEVSLARLLRDVGKDAEAEGMYAHAIPILRSAFPTDRRMMNDLVDLGTIRCARDLEAGLASIAEGIAALEAEGAGGAESHARALEARQTCVDRWSAS